MVNFTTKTVRNMCKTPGEMDMVDNNNDNELTVK